MSNNEPIVLCPGEIADVCLEQDWPVIEWFIFPGYDGEFAPGAATNQQCTQVTGNIQGNYGVLVTDASGCQGQNIQLVQVTNNYIDESNENNNGSYCDVLAPVTFEGGFTNPAQDNLVIYGLSPNLSLIHN